MGTTKGACGAGPGFTPGPWRVMPGRYSFSFRIHGKNGEPVMSSDEAGDVPSAKANARLIAAAPDLYEALREVKRQTSVGPPSPPGRKSPPDSWYGLLVSINASVSAVLAKAEGRAAERSDAPGIPKFGTPGCAGGSEES